MKIINSKLYEREDTKAIILASHFIAANKKEELNRLWWTVSESTKIKLEEFIKATGKSEYLRIVRIRKSDNSKIPLNLNLKDNTEVYWKCFRIGNIKTFFKSSLPGETQSRLAYISLIDRFLQFLVRKSLAVLLEENEHILRVFIPVNNFNINNIWDEFIQEIFSIQELSRTFVNMVNTIKLANRGFSALFKDQEIPEIGNFTEVLVGFYIANLESAKREFEAKSKRTKTKDKDKEKAAKNAQTVKEILQDLLKSGLDKKRFPLHLFSEIARNQISRDPAKLKATSEDIKRILNNRTRKLSIQCLLSNSLQDYRTIKPPGDSEMEFDEFCYVCGKPFTPSETKFEVRRFIFESPDQRPQSGRGQRRPKACSNCLLVSIVSPIKMTDSVIVIKFKQEEEILPIYEEHLRMFVMGELNLFAGRYVLLKSTEEVTKKRGRDPLSKVMGLRQYAILKLSTLIPHQVFNKYKIFLIYEGSEIPLVSRHIILTGFLIRLFRIDHRWAYSDFLKDFHHILASVIRYIESDRLFHAVYEILIAEKKNRPLIQNVLPSFRRELEEVREKHIKLLEGGDNNMSCKIETSNKAQFYRDIAGLTGILSAFIRHTESQLKSDPAQQKREVKKLIERCDDPLKFTYTVSETLKVQYAKFWRNNEDYFCYDEAKRLLKEIGIESLERENTSSNQPELTLYSEDIKNTYQHLLSKYSDEKDKREFKRALRLSLWSKFPEYLKK